MTKLVHYKSLFSNAFRYTPIGMAILALDGTCLKANPFLCKMTGYPEEDLQGRTIQQMIYKDDDSTELSFLQPLLEGQIEIFEIEKRLIHKLGNLVWVQITVSLVRDETGAPLYYMIHLKDITEHKQFVHELQESEERYRQLIEFSPDPIAVHHEGKFLYANRAAIAFVEAEKEEEVLGHSMFEFIHPDYWEFSQQVSQYMLETGNAMEEIELRLVKKNGQEMDAIFSAIPISYMGKTCIQVSYKNITLRKLLEEDLRINHERIRNTLKAAKLGTTLVDLSQGRLLEPDSVLQQILGYGKEELLGKPFAELTHPDDIQPNLDLYHELISGQRESYHLEKRYIRKDGQVIWGNLTVAMLQKNPPSVMAILEDITERKLTEEKLKLYAKVMQTTQQGVIITDQDTRIIWVNEAFTKLTGYSLEETIGQKPSFLRSGKHDTQFYRYMWESILNTGHWRGELWNCNKKKEIYAEHLSISAVRNEQGHITNYVGVFTDISEMKKVELELQNANERLSKLTMLDGLTGIANRRCFDQTLLRDWNQMKRDQKLLSLLLIDIDFFKRLNDFYGHQEGDDCLKRVSQMLKSCAKRPSDVVARYGGEEFAVILPNTSSEGAYYLAETIRLKIHDLKIPNIHSEVCEHLTVSIGVATMIPCADCCLEDLIKMADQALYQAKKEGRNRSGVCVLTE